MNAHTHLAWYAGLQGHVAMNVRILRLKDVAQMIDHHGDCVDARSGYPQEVMTDQCRVS